MEQRHRHPRRTPARSRWFGTRGRRLAPTAAAAALLWAVAAPSSPAEDTLPKLNRHRPLPNLPVGVASFGAAASGGWLYVYGGHTGQPHVHSTENLSPHFVRLNIDKPLAWQELPRGPALQSPGLVAWRDGVVRIGGMSARNPPDQPEDLHSSDEVAWFDATAGRWTPLPRLPEPRSSHDAASDGRMLYVVGGWSLGDATRWHDTAWQFDPAAAEPAWQPLPAPPFRRRALAVAVLGQQLLAIGGMGEGGPSRQVDILDLRAGRWRRGPDLPELPGGGFGCAAVVVDQRLYVSTLSGHVLRLTDDQRSWSQIGRLQPARFFHRLAPWGPRQAVAVGGASPQGHLDLVEPLALDGQAVDD